MHKVGVIGNGFVGSAIASGFGLHADVKVYDADSRRSINTFDEVMECEFIFVAVPTPMHLGDNNKIDLSIVKDTFSKISNYSQEYQDKNKIIILKSTAIPGTTESLQKEFPTLDIAFNPEFLTERNARLDFINTSRIVIGGSSTVCDRVEQLYRVRFPHTSIISTDPTSAEFIKYMCNCFFSVKISFMNEMKQASEALDLSWIDVMNGFLSDGRIGNSHVDVPGHDGHLGFGGKCFPKDLNAFINLFNDIHVEPTMLSAAWSKNMEVRKIKDWESIKGATSGKNNKD
tara:strand:+ start:990 stop:1850 length:861 start_codon:yes stop_codon:yes gene_type:complete